MKKTGAIWFTGISLVIMMACHHEPAIPNEPKAVLSQFFKDIRDKDIEAASKLATDSSQKTLQLLKTAVAILETIKAVGGKSGLAEDYLNLEVGASRITGSDAYVAVFDQKKKDSADFHLQLEKGKWKVDFSPDALARMDGNSPRSKQIKNLLDQGILDKFSPDSIGNSFKMIDSLRKQLRARKDIDSLMKSVPLDSTR